MEALGPFPHDTLARLSQLNEVHVRNAIQLAIGRQINGLCVTVKEGCVELAGTCPSYACRVASIEAAKRAAGPMFLIKDELIVRRSRVDELSPRRIGDP